MCPIVVNEKGLLHFRLFDCEKWSNRRFATNNSKMLPGFYRPTDTPAQKKLRDTASALVQIVGCNEEKMGYLMAELVQISNHLPTLMGQESEVNERSTSDNEYGNDNTSEDSSERSRIARRLQGFDQRDNVAWLELSRRFGSNLKQGELQSIAQALAEGAGIKLDRDAKRRKIVLLKWFEENWLTIKPFLEFVVLEDSRPDTR